MAKEEEAAKPFEPLKVTFTVAWSSEDAEYVGTCDQFPSMSHLAKDRDEALEGIVGVVLDALRDMATSGEALPWNVPR